MFPTPPNNNIGLPSGSGTGSCWDVTINTGIPATVGGIVQNNDITAQLLPHIGPFATVQAGASGNLITVQAPSIPTGIQNIHSSLSVNIAVPLGTLAHLFIQQFSIAGVNLNAGLGVDLQGGQGSGTAGPFAIHPQGVYWAAVTSASDVTSFLAQAEFRFDCTAPGTLSTPCCPPDPLVQNYLTQIDAKLNALLSLPTAVPKTAWADATAHNGITGTGNFVIQPGVTGIRAAFTTIPPGIRQTAGTPTFFWALGFVTPVNRASPYRSLRTVFANQSMPVPLQTTSIDYTFPPGVVVNLVELVPA